MAKRKERDLVDWHHLHQNIDMAEWFIKLGSLDTIDSAIIRGRRDDIKQGVISQQQNVSIDTIKKRTQKLVLKYIEVQKLHNRTLPRIKAGYLVDLAVVTIMPLDSNEVYTLVIQDELFESFESIVSEAKKRLEANGFIKRDSFSAYKSTVSGVYTCYN